MKYVIYVYFIIKLVVKRSENSVRFEFFLWELPFRLARICEILSHSVRYGMYAINGTKFCFTRCQLKIWLHPEFLANK